MIVDTLRFVVLTQGIPAGAHVIVRDSPTIERFSYEFNDRGRGPKTETRLELDSAGQPRALAITGVDYLKQPVDERLTSAQGRLRWSSASERGDATGPGFYLPLESAPEIDAALVRAALRRPGHAIPVLPAGE